MEDSTKDNRQVLAEQGELTKFADSYESFNRIVNSLQRKYIELKDEFSAQNEELAKANKKLVELSRRNLAATQFLNSILEAVPVGVISVDEKGIVSTFNPAASVILGLPRGEPVGREYRDVIPHGHPIDANALRTFELGAEVSSVDKTMDLADGSSLNLSVSTSILNDKDGKPMGAVEVLHDLTKVKKMEQEIARLNTLAALGEMAATIAHEVRNPLSGISGFAALLERDLAEDDPKREITKKIVAGVSSLNDTISTLLNYTRFQEMNKRLVIYSDFISAVIDQYRNDNQDKIKNTKITIEPMTASDKSEIPLTLDPMLFRQIFFNIISNAIEAGKGRANIDISFRKMPRQTAIAKYGDKILLAHDETAVETKITDDGPGIDQEHIKSIFSPFFTTRPGGTGLGLAVAAKIVKTHGGEISVETETGSGTTFTLLIPTAV